MASAEPQLTIIGAGELAASSYLPAAAALGWKAVLVDSDIDRAEQLAGQHRIVREVRPSISEAALSSQAAVVIATPARTHAELGLEAIQAGARQILLEKPPTTNRKEYEELTSAAAAVGATITTSFLRRGWHSIKTSRARFDAWLAAYGTLRRASLIEGSPWGWKSMATRERGAEGLEEILLDELSHGFDALFHVTGWEAPARDPLLSVETNTLWEFRGSARGASGNRDLALGVAVSRTHVLANAIVLDFEGATVTVELSPSGGICVRPSGEPQLLIEGPSALDSVAEQFAQLLQEAFTQAVGETSPPLSEWAGPLALISGFRAADADGQPVESRR
ncbi:MAG: Gfo/Idh/MocA family protein [Solirubrobacterales bacterium]